jgi:hypothetical protein
MGRISRIVRTMPQSLDGTVCAAGKSREFGLTARRPNRQSSGRDRDERNASSIGLESKRPDLVKSFAEINRPTIAVIARLDREIQ